MISALYTTVHGSDLVSLALSSHCSCFYRERFPEPKVPL